MHGEHSSAQLTDGAFYDGSSSLSWTLILVVESIVVQSALDSENTEEFAECAPHIDITDLTTH